MECNVSFDSGDWASSPCQHQTGIDFDCLRPSDKVVIRTRNSTYRFLVKDPAGRRGVLAGGALGDEARNAVVFESLQDAIDRTLQRAGDLRTGVRVLFLLSSPHGAEWMKTSVVEELFLIRPGEETPPLA